jgi:hypothetical protein
MQRNRVILTILWWTWGLLLIVLQVVLSYQPAIFGDDASAAWEWLLPNLTPTLLLVGAVSYQQRRKGRQADQRHLFGIAVAASIIYLLLLTIAVLSVLFTTDPVAMLHKSNLWLGPLQGLTASLLGLFFAAPAKD